MTMLNIQSSGIFLNWQKKNFRFMPSTCHPTPPQLVACTRSWCYQKVRSKHHKNQPIALAVMPFVVMDLLRV